MGSFMGNNLLKFILILYSVSSGEKTMAAELFYENPNLSLLIQHLPHDKTKKCDIHEQKILTIQVTFALLKNPKLLPDLINKLDSVAPSVQTSIVQGIVNAQGKKAEINDKYNLSPQNLVEEINKIEFIFPSDTLEKMDFNCKTADYLWAAFHMTGNKEYLLKIITFLNQFPLQIRILAAEAINREAIQRILNVATGTHDQKTPYQDILDTLTVDEITQFYTYKIISWSLASNREQYPTIDTMVEKIFSSQPNLDFYRNVNL